MSMLDSETRQALIKIFSGFPRAIQDYLIISDKGDCETCEEAVRLADEITAVSGGKLRFRVVNKDSDEAMKLRPRYVPAFIYDLPVHNVRYYGLPAGQEFPPFIYVHEYIAKNKLRLPESVISEVKGINKSLHVKVFVTPECPVCPMVVDTLNQIGIVNPKILVEVIEAVELPWEADKYNVMYVPAIIVDDIVRHDGYAPPDQIVAMLKQVFKRKSVGEGS